MRATILGKARNLNISCENGDKRFLGEVNVERGAFIYEAFDDEKSCQTIFTKRRRLHRYICSGKRSIASASSRSQSR